MRDLVREGDLLARIDHPVVVRGFGTAAAGGPFPHLLLEHLEGPTLQALLDAHGPVGLEQLLPLGMHVASALHYLAARGRRAPRRQAGQPRDGRPAAADRLQRLARPGRRRAPDQARRHRRSTWPRSSATARAGRSGPPVDVFGLGATMYRAMTGERAFPRADGAARSEDPKVRFPQLVRAPAPLPRRTPAPLAELLRAMLAPQPGERPTAAEVVAALEPVVAELPRRLVLGRRGWRARR